jgi:hypothetical protein
MTSRRRHSPPTSGVHISRAVFVPRSSINGASLPRRSKTRQVAMAANPIPRAPVRRTVINERGHGIVSVTIGRSHTMSDAGVQAVDLAHETTSRYRAAVEARDVDAFLATLAPEITLHSPITERIEFSGHEQMRTLMRALFVSIEDIRYFEDVGDATSRALFYRAHVGSQEVEEASLVRLNSAALVTDIRLWFRPLPGLTAVMSRLGPAYAREQGRGHAVAASLLTAPLAAVTRAGDALGARLVRPV